MEAKDKRRLGDLHSATLLWVSFKNHTVGRLVSDGASIGAYRFT